jgi:tRNA (guanine-N7-)-methyltransferase
MIDIMSNQVRPARPHTGLTEDGRRLAQVLTYTRRGSRMTDRQAVAWERHREQWWVPDEAVDAPDFDVRRVFDDPGAPLIVEIGSGIGEATAALAAARPSYNVVAFEVWRPGVAETLIRLADREISNVRLLSVDAVWSMEHLLGEAEVAELWTFFPDPWPKKRHHRRRLVNPRFARLAATRLVPGGVWRLATDWPDYADAIHEVLESEPLLENVYDEPAPRWDERPLTRFERRGLRAGRPIRDFAYRRGRDGRAGHPAAGRRPGPAEQAQGPGDHPARDADLRLPAATFAQLESGRERRERSGPALWPELRQEGASSPARRARSRGRPPGFDMGPGSLTR